MKFKTENERLKIEEGTVITILTPAEDGEEAKVAHLMVLKGFTPLIPIPAYQLVNLDDLFVIPRYFSELEEIEKFVHEMCEDGAKVIRVTANKNIEIVEK